MARTSARSSLEGVAEGDSVSSHHGNFQGKQRLGHSHDIMLEFERINVANAGVQADLVVNEQENCVLTREKAAFFMPVKRGSYQGKW